MAKVSNLAISLQSGTDSTYYATWKFNSTITNTSSGKIKVGDYVTVKSGAKWYNGVSIASFVFSDSWKVIEISGSRAVLGPNKSGSNNITSAIDIKYLEGGSGGSSTVSVNTLDHYTVAWAYDTGDGIWFSGESSDVTSTNATYSGPANATRIRVGVKPVSKTHKVNGKDTSYWSGTTVYAYHSISSNPPEVPSTPTVEIDKYNLTAYVDNISDSRSEEIQFQVYDGTKVFSTGTAKVVACLASYKCKVKAGGSYRVRCRAANVIGSKRSYSDWSDFTSSSTTIPSTPSSITKIRGSSSTSIYLEWTSVNSAETYDIEYTTKLKYFDGSSETTVVSGIEFNHYEQTGLDTGEEYFFRVRAVNEKGESGWSSIKSIVIGKPPAAPTTWSSSSTVITGDPLTLYWVHNAEDGSRQTYAEVEITINDDTQTYTIKSETSDEEEDEKTYSYSVDTSKYNEGVDIKWRVRTAGITKIYGDWSIQRTVEIYAPPTLELSVTDKEQNPIEILTSFPFYINGLAGPSTQMPIGYHISITADDGYETVDYIGKNVIISAGDEVYSNYIDTNDPLLLELSAGNVNLENGISYTIAVTVSMNSGLTAFSSKTIEVSWSDAQYNVDAEIAIDPNTYVAYITPYSRDEEGYPISGLSLSVYRREFDGLFVELSTGLDSEKNTVVTDPHPSLDYARYRIVAMDNTTGSVSFYDPPGYPIGCTSIILQWDEEWSYFDATNDAERVEQPWSGSFLELRYNVDVSDNNETDSTLVEYIGRSHPVSYYGTQIGSKATWNTVIPTSDKDTLYALRRLSIWMGDVYVREPSGSGYWANIKVSFSQKHNDLTIPITFDITRVDGGI